MSLHVIPLVQEFYLATDETEIPENRIIPTSIGRTGKIESGYVHEKSHHCYSRYYINILYSIVLHNTRAYQYPYSHIIQYSDLMKIFLFFTFKYL